MHFANILFLFLLIVIPVLIWYGTRIKRKSVLRFSHLELIKRTGKRPYIYREVILNGLRIVSLILIIIALARPQQGKVSEEYLSKGIDIILCLDTSTSMQALDFKPKNRLQAAKEVARSFIQGRKNDRIGVVVFGGVSFTQCPLTTDKTAILKLLDDIEIGITQVDGTAIGTAIATCVSHLKESQAKSKVVILLTDGRNNTGEIDPLTAAEMANSMGIKIYTVGAGSPGEALFPVDHPFWGRQYVPLPEELDEETLKKIALASGGLYFRAKDSKALEEIFKRINELEKTPIKSIKYTHYRECYLYFIFPAFFLLLIEVALQGTILRKIP